MHCLHCKFRNNVWGKQGSESEVYKLLSNANKEKLSLSEFYAELWMGTHPSAPSFIQSTDQCLSEYLSKNRQHVGESVLNFFQLECDEGKVQLPFLFKVLSIEKALAIQAHPNKTHAEELHAKYPHLYPDSNHKPEMVVALTPFEALCGFRALKDVQLFIMNNAELMTLVTTGSEENRQCQLELLNKALLSETYEQQNDIYKFIISNLLRSPDTLVSQQLEKLVQKLKNSSSINMTEEDRLLLELSEQYPGDVGCFFVYFLNKVCLRPGEAIFLEVNLPHAYLKGDCVEILACSDNVIRAGLTSKPKEIETLIEMLDYRSRSPKDLLFHPELIFNDVGISRYAPSIPDFALERILITAFSESSIFTLPVHDSASILLCISGQATIGLINTSLDEQAKEILQRGVVIFLSAGLGAEIIWESSEDDLQVFRAYGNVEYILKDVL